jgi:MSHA pilin protein MshC
LLVDSHLIRTCRSESPLQSGFTMTELVTIMVIIGVLAAVAMPRFFESDPFRNRAATDQSRAALRYAQKAAIAARAPVTVTFSNGDPANCSATVVAGAVGCVLPNSVTLGGALAVTFDSLGRPVPNAAVTVVVAGTTITVAAETGYVR